MEKGRDPLAALWLQEPLGVSWAEWPRSSRPWLGLRRTVWYELQARDWPLKNQAAEASIWQIGSGEGMKRVLASVSLGKEVSVSSTCPGWGSRAEGGVGRVAWPPFTHPPEKWGHCPGMGKEQGGINKKISILTPLLTFFIPFSLFFFS